MVHSTFPQRHATKAAVAAASQRTGSASAEPPWPRPRTAGNTRAESTAGGTKRSAWRSPQGSWPCPTRPMKDSLSSNVPAPITAMVVQTG